jgi:hypothetical protein
MGLSNGHVQGIGLEEPLRIELTRSPERPLTTAICRYCSLMGQEQALASIRCTIFATQAPIHTLIGF